MPKVSARQSDWSLAAPFFLSAMFYLTAVFALLAPLPLLLIYFKKGRVWTLAASLANAILVALLGGPASLLIYTVSVLVLTWILGETLNRKISVEKSAGITFLGMIVVAAAILVILTWGYHLDLVRQFHAQISDWVEKAGKPLVAESKLFNPGDFDEWKRSLWVEFLPATGVTLIVMIWANLTWVIKSNAGGIRERLALDPKFLSQWKAPQFLVWPTIVAGFLLIFDFGIASDVGWVLFELLMAVYAIQGLSILSSVFDLWNTRGLLRVIGYSVSLVLMLPLVLSLGFFDLWFDFRGKFRQT